jgi:tRNA threonylcarbamoyladenosine biosynthesis protein TsaE
VTNLIIKNLADLPNAVRWLTPYLRDHPILALSGDLGSGKTTLVKAVCASLGVIDDVSSPTFSMINIYHTAEQLEIHHIDLYRLQSLDEALQIGIEDYLNQDTLTFIEWPELIDPLLPEGTLHLKMSHIDKERRKIVIL